MNFDNLDSSDESTGLPALGNIEDERTAALVVKGNSSEGLVMLHESEPIPVRYLHCRVLMQGTQGAPVDWGQVSLAIPQQLVPEIVRRLTELS